MVSDDGIDKIAWSVRYITFQSCGVPTNDFLVLWFAENIFINQNTQISNLGHSAFAAFGALIHSNALFAMQPERPQLRQRSFPFRT
jgi:hypothetical protein